MLNCLSICRYWFPARWVCAPRACELAVGGARLLSCATLDVRLQPECCMQLHAAPHAGVCKGALPKQRQWKVRQGAPPQTAGMRGKIRKQFSACVCVCVGVCVCVYLYVCACVRARACACVLARACVCGCGCVGVGVCVCVCVCVWHPQVPRVVTGWAVHSQRGGPRKEGATGRRWGGARGDFRAHAQLRQRPPDMQANFGAEVCGCPETPVLVLCQGCTRQNAFVDKLWRPQRRWHSFEHRIIGSNRNRNPTLPTASLRGTNRRARAYRR